MFCRLSGCWFQLSSLLSFAGPHSSFSTFCKHLAWLETFSSAWKNISRAFSVSWLTWTGDLFTFAFACGKFAEFLSPRQFCNVQKMPSHVCCQNTFLAEFFSSLNWLTELWVMASLSATDCWGTGWPAKKFENSPRMGKNAAFDLTSWQGATSDLVTLVLCLHLHSGELWKSKMPRI